MKQLLHIARHLLFSTGILAGAAVSVSAQSTVIPVPFSTVAAGLAAGSGNVLCTSGYYKNINGVNTGDGCSPTQATLTSLYDVQVDAAGNLYMSENGTNDDIRVVYRGGTTLYNMLIAANPSIPNFAPVPGNIYTLAGGLTGSITTKSGSTFLCGNIAGGVSALASTGNGCPAAQSYIKPRGLAIDQYGNVFTTSNGSGSYINVIYAGGTANTTIAKLITLENPTVTTPQLGYIYKIVGSTTAGYAGDNLAVPATVEFEQLRYLAVDSNENIYISDGTTGGGSTSASNNNVRMVNGTTGVITTIVGETACENANGTSNYSGACPAGNAGSGVPASGALLNSPYALFVDASNNLYIADYYNSVVRVLYQTAGSTLMGLGNKLTVGNLYTVLGGGAATVTLPNTPATTVKFANLYVAGIDHAGNLYAQDGTSKYIWRFDAKTALGTIIAGGGATATSLPKACATGEPQNFTDNFGDGCPATQAVFSTTGTLTFDPQGNFYEAENGNGVVRELSYNSVFPSTAVGSSASQYQAFEVVATAGTPSATGSLTGGASTEYSATTSACTATGAQTGFALCEANVTFAPQHDGQRAGSLTLTGTATTYSEDLSGIGLGSDLAIDPGTQSTLGTGLSPAGVATDLSGNVYVTDTTSNSVLKGAATGTTLTTLVTGLSAPKGVALDGQGNLYIANSGANNIVVASPSGTVTATLGTGLSAPQGVAVDSLGHIFVSDTGNNRIVQVYANGYQTMLPIFGISAPKQMVLDQNGNLFIIDSGNNRIVEYSILTGQTAPSATLAAAVVPAAVAVDPGGNLYVADSAGKQLLLYAVGATSANTLLSGLGTPVGLAADPDANLFLADSAKTGALELRRSVGNIVLPLAAVTASSAQTTTQSITVDNVGNSALTFTGPPLSSVSGANAGLFAVAPSSSNGCSTSVTYTSGNSCNFTASFTPTGTGSFMANAYFNSNAGNTGTAVADLSGTGKYLITTNTTLAITTPASAPYYYGQNFLLTAGLSPSTLVTSNGSETFTYTIDGQSQPTPVPTSQNTLALSPQAGSHSVTVTYNSDGTYATSSATVNFTVLPAVTTAVLTVAPVNNAGVLTLNFTAAITSPTASGETGIVSFFYGTPGNGTLIGSSNVNASGLATFSSSTLTFPVNTFYAVYTASTINGNVDFTNATSAVVSPVSDFAIGIPASAVSIAQGGVASLAFNIAPLYGGGGTVTPSCTGLPANSVCRFQPQSFTLSGAPVTENLLIYTNVSSTLAQNRTPLDTTTFYLAFGLPLGLGLLWMRRRTTSRLLGVASVAVMALAAIAGVSGCSGTSVNQNSGNTVTPAGTYTVGVVFTGSAGLTTTHTANVAFTVITNTGTY